MPWGQRAAWYIMTDSTVQVEAPAYVKLMLHAAKYPWAAVNGFLLGEGSAASKGTVRLAQRTWHVPHSLTWRQSLAWRQFFAWRRT